MFESNPTTSTSENIDRNAQLLEQAQGPTLKEAYLAALRLDPRLEAVDLITNTDDAPYAAFASPGWSNKSGRHEVHVQLSGENGSGLIHDDIDAVPGARQLFADIVGIPPDSLTPEASNAFTLVHEFGHVSQFFDYDDRPAELDQRRKRDWMALPLGAVATSVLMNPSSREHSIIEQCIKDGIAPLGMNTMQEAYSLQHSAYRQMFDEKAADDFARAVFSANPDIVQSLI